LKEKSLKPKRKSNGFLKRENKSVLKLKETPN